MTTARVHELAKEFGVESKWVLEKIREGGDFVKSASSRISLQVEMRFRQSYGEQLNAGIASAEVTPVSDMSSMDAAADARNRILAPGRIGGPSGAERRPLTGQERERLKPPRQTSWSPSPFDETGEQIWRRAGLGDADAPLAMYLLEPGHPSRGHWVDAPRTSCGVAPAWR